MLQVLLLKDLGLYQNQISWNLSYANPNPKHVFFNFSVEVINAAEKIQLRREQKMLLRLAEHFFKVKCENLCQFS